MAASRASQELTTLLETRAKLEAALAGDENWRALQQAAGRGGGEDSAARRARNTRLKMALAENPLFQAWRHVGEAIDALQAAAASAPPETAPPRPGSLAARLAAGVALPAEEQTAKTERIAPAHQPRVVPGPRPPPPMQPIRRIRAEPDEATVTFVRREGGEGAASGPAHDHPDPAADAHRRAASFAPPRAGRDEADVEIVPGEGAESSGPPEQRLPKAK